MMGPTGIGVLYAKRDILDEMEPFLVGGEMVLEVWNDRATWNDLPMRFEAGTPDIADAIALGAAVDYVTKLGFDQITAHEAELLRYGTQALSSIAGVRIIGTAAHKAGILSFVMDKAHPHDIGTILDEQGIAIRTGHHCAQPVMLRFQIPATARASLAFYNTKEDIDALVIGIDRVLEVFS
jgi:cysteine desulfurase/selenocysteine lyase